MPPGCGGAGEEEEKKKTEEDELCECFISGCSSQDIYIYIKKEKKYVFKTVNDRLQLCCGRPAEPAAWQALSIKSEGGAAGGGVGGAAELSERDRCVGSR